jgi:putative phosphoribosyl transferase
MRVFADRAEAGRLLAKELARYVVAFQVAAALSAPLDVYMVRKLGVPGQEELALGAIASGGVRVLNPDVVRAAGLDQAHIDAVTVRERAELERREQLYRGDMPPLELAARTVILVDDGLATGASMRTAIHSLELHRPGWITMAVPTGPRSTCSDLEREVDEAVCLTTPEPFFGVGQWYIDFSQTTDDEVIELLHQARVARARQAGDEPSADTKA